jgi:hypothetical protein
VLNNVHVCKGSFDCLDTNLLMVKKIPGGRRL